jgi:serine/threonine-protein kinase
MELLSDASAFDPRLARPKATLPKRGSLVALRYRLGDDIGDGGMSVVFSARDELLGRDVALKVLNPELAYSPEIVTRFVNEARTLAQLDCQHVVRVFDAGVTAEPGRPVLPFMVLELLRGMELRSLVTQIHLGNVSRVIGWLLQICDGLAAAHVEGIIHRDLKPANLFVVDDADGSQVVKVLDFGIARSMQGVSATVDGARMGSPGYMSPEQIRDASSVDERSDIWSLGVIMYELFSGVAPFVAENPLELCVQILNFPVEPLAKVRPDLPPGLAAVVHRCMQRTVAARFANIAELADALSAFALPRDVEVAARVRRRLKSRSQPVGSAPVASLGSSPLATPAQHLRSEGPARAAGRPHPHRVLAVAAALGLVSFVAATAVLRAPARSREFAAATSARLAAAAQNVFRK